MKIMVADNYQAMSEAAARQVIAQIKMKNDSVLCLPTGGTPIGLYENLVKACRDKEVSFKRVKVFILDEYAGLSKTDSHSFHYFISSRLLNLIDIKKENVFTPDGAAKDLKKECANYEALIEKHGGIDLLVLGIGLNGHVAFNEPGSDFNSKTRVVELTEQTRCSNAKYFESPDQAPLKAITMGLGAIMKAKKIIFMAAGEEKAEIVKRALIGRITKSVPASVLQKHKDCAAILDKGAGKGLIVK